MHKLIEQRREAIPGHARTGIARSASVMKPGNCSDRALIELPLKVGGIDFDAIT